MINVSIGWIVLLMGFLDSDLQQTKFVFNNVCLFPEMSQQTDQKILELFRNKKKQ